MPQFPRMKPCDGKITDLILTCRSFYRAWVALNTSQLLGCCELSNAIEVLRVSAESGRTTFNLYPNPTSDKINISLGTLDASQIRATLHDFGGNDITGKMVRTNDAGLSFDVSSLPSGIYLLRLFDGKWSVTKKVVIP